MDDTTLETAKESLKRMIRRDKYSAWLGLDIVEIQPGYCKLTYNIRKEMLNGFGTVHGGVLFSASDSAFAFASNSYGILSVALDVNITYVKSSLEGDRLTLEAEEDYTGNRTGVYRVVTYNQNREKICIFNGTVYRTGKPIPSA